MAFFPVVHDTPQATDVPDQETPLSKDETWELIFRMFDSGKEIFAECGGGEAFLRAERAAWDERRYD